MDASFGGCRLQWSTATQTAALRAFYPTMRDDDVDEVLRTMRVADFSKALGHFG